MLSLAAEKTGSEPRKPALMTAHELARLIGVLTESDEARSALLHSRMNLTRVEQQRRDDRDAFWKSAVARLNNDHEVVVSKSYAGMVETDDEHTCLNPNLNVPQRRPDSWLKSKYFGTRALLKRATVTGAYRVRTILKVVSSINLYLVRLHQLSFQCKEDSVTSCSTSCDATLEMKIQIFSTSLSKLCRMVQSTTTERKTTVW